MLLRYFYDKKLAQASYMVGCVRTGEAMVVDPNRDIQQYLNVAAEEGLKITHITETHIHADFVSGSRELGAATGATIYLSDMGDANWKYQFASEPNVVSVQEGDFWKVGNIKIEVLATPGHTPEHISFLVTDTAGADKPMGVFTGDFLFVGDIGRPDLLEEAAGMIGTADIGANAQFQSVQRFKGMPDYLQIWPAHGAGSACGKALGAIPSTTLGYEKLFNPAFQFENQAEFVAWLRKDQPEAPRYFAQMKKVNKIGPALLDSLPEPKKMDRAALNELLEAGEFVVDFRSRDAFAKGHVPGTVSIPTSNSSFSTYVGWFVDYERPLYLIVEKKEQLPELLSALQGIGADNVAGYFTSDVLAAGTEPLPQMSAAELGERMSKNGMLVIDVRGATEYAEEHIKGAHNIAVGWLPRHLDELPEDKLIVTQCASGYRAQVATSLLRSKGFSNVVLMGEPASAWSKILPTVAGS